MKILIAGLPGSGKTTQSKKIADELGFTLIQMGETLRQIAKEGGSLGERVRQIMSTGELVDDETVSKIIKKKVSEIGAGKNIVMEGYPRSVAQIELFDPNFDKIFYLVLSEDEQMKRMNIRGRMDDTPEAIKTRIRVQKEGLDKVLSKYRSSPRTQKDKIKIIEVDASKSINQVFEEIAKELRK